jgi:hypothetical protein
MLVCGLAGAGCSKKSSVDTAPLETNFKSADPATQSNVDKAVGSIKAGDYASATADLQMAAKDAKLTPQQKQAIQDVLAQIQKTLADAAGKAAEGMEKAGKDLQKSLPK